jgi:hypothetical protein
MVMTVALKSSTVGDTASIQINGADVITIGTTGITTGYAPASITQAALANAPVVMTPVVVSAAVNNVEFTGIPTWAKKIIIFGENISSTGAIRPRIQVGPTAAVETTGYVSVGSTNGADVTDTNGFGLFGTAVTAASFIVTMLNVSGNIWVCSATSAYSNTKAGVTSGYKTTATALARVKLTIDGVSTFTAGTVTVRYEP